MTDYVFHGEPQEVAKSLEATAGNSDYSVLGPRTLDGVAYASVRTDSAFTIPSGATVTGPELSAVILGVWYDAKNPLAGYIPAPKNVQPETAQEPAEEPAKASETDSDA